MAVCIYMYIYICMKYMYLAGNDPMNIGPTERGSSENHRLKSAFFGRGCVSFREGIHMYIYNLPGKKGEHAQKGGVNFLRTCCGLY